MKNAKYWLPLMIWLLIFLVMRNFPIVTELFIRGREPDIFLVFITQSSFTVSKNIRLNSTHYFIERIPNKRESQ